MRSLALVFALGLLATSAVSQPPQPPELPVAVSKHGVIVVQTGTLSVLKRPDRKPPVEVRVSREDLLGVRLDPVEPTGLVLTGKLPGAATVTVLNTDKSQEVYEVAIEAPGLQIAKRVRAGYVAFSLALPQDNAVGGYVGMNDYVIVYATKTADPDKKTRTLMKNVRVLSVPIGNDTRMCVLLEVTTEEAKVLRSATESGTLALGLVAEADVKNEKLLQDRKGDTEAQK